MKRRTIRIGTRMLQVELHAHGWEIVPFDKDGQASGLWIEGTLEARDDRIEKVGGKLALEGFR